MRGWGLEVDLGTQFEQPVITPPSIQIGNLVGSGRALVKRGLSAP